MNVKKTLILGFLLFASKSVFCEPISEIDIKKALEKRLKFIFDDDGLKKSGVGVEVFSLSRQESLFSLNSTKVFSPASAVKLLTALVALKKLGPDYVYKTEVFVDGPIKDGVLQGNIYLKGSGDPSLVTERLYLLGAEVQRSLLKRVNGSLVVDDWTFDQVRHDPARIPTQTDRAYNAPVGGMSFNYNTTTVYFKSGEKVGDSVRVMVEPDTGYVVISNKAKTSNRGGAYKVVASRISGKDRNADTDALLVSGSMPLGLYDQRSFFNITNPVQYAGAAFKTLLLERGILISGKQILHSKVPITATKIAELESLPLREIVTLMNKFSNNFIADTLVKTLGREVRGAPGTMEKGLAVIMEESTRLGINTSGFNLVSGSGLTRENRISAEQFVTLMNAAYKDFDVFPELLASLPIAGRDGTLRSRMKGTTAAGRLRAKTGSIDGVSSLVGMVQSRGGELLAFAVILNDQSKNPGSLRPWQNFLAQALSDFNRKVPLSEKPDPLPASISEGPLED